ncbi:peptidase m20 [Trichoderma arundinaceum]|uniref:Peptidase m20 n=1 Tax=Trichoderma arundinaceum TaxID=490622 RepID=A0A395NJK4_TRIAR|nr:peptidase m20 [Trichoderma arundinaceum]
MDIRHLSEATLEIFESAVDVMANLLKAENSGLDFQIERTWHSPTADIDPSAIKCTQDAACDAVGAGQLMEMVSFAGRDSASTAMAVPTSMIFVPSRDVISQHRRNSPANGTDDTPKQAEEPLKPNQLGNKQAT